MTKLGLYGVLAIIFLLPVMPIEAQQCSLHHFSVNEGLIQSEVNKIIQDNKKYIWIATKGGVSLFAGVKFKNYKLLICFVHVCIS